MINSVAICPHPPLLVASVASGAASETDDLRAACDIAIARLLVVAPQQVVVIGSDGGAQARGASGGLRGFAPGVADLPTYDLPLPLMIGNWLLDRVIEANPTRHGVVVRPNGLPVDDWPDLSPSTALLVMADGSARRSPKGPGYFDARAEPFDAAVTTALGAPDLETLANLDVDLADALLVGGVGPFKALAALARGISWRSDVLYDAAPYGVQYTVATWTRG